MTLQRTAIAQPVVYVDAKATGANDGSSWTDAFTELQPALDAAEASGGSIHEISVAYGTYKPSKRTDPDDPRSATFQLIDGVSLYGGFTGKGEPIDERHIDANETILSGDFNGDDDLDFINYDENAYHVVLAIDIENSIIFDGLTVTGGHSPGPGSLGGYGGGMHLENAYPEIRNCTFTRNLAERPEGNVAWSGGGGAALFLYQEDTYPGPPPLTVSRSHFTDNSSAGDGGAVFIWGADAAGGLDFSECSFERNVGLGAFSAFKGTAHSFRSCSFSDNNSSNRSGGAISTYYHGGELLIDQCRFERNSAQSGGAVHWNGGLSVTIFDSIFVDNSAASYGGGGAVLISNADRLELFDTEFVGNGAGNGAGAQLDWNGTTTVRQCRFIGNSSDDWGGGGLHMTAYGTASLTDCMFANNRAYSGGGLYTDGSVIVENCVFSDNYAIGYGGGFATNWSASLIGCTFTGNFADEGGGLHHRGSELTVVDTKFEFNYATLGGGVLIDGYDGATFKRCWFLHNTADAGGGVAINGDADVLLERCTLTVNSAYVGGGLSGIGAGGGTTLFNSLIAENDASAYGGGIAGGAGPLTVTNCSIANNTAGALGAGLIAGHDTTVKNSIVWGNVVDPVGGAWMDEVAQIEGIEFATIGYSDVQGWSGAFGGEGNIGDDPLFVDPIDDGTWVPWEPDFHLRPESPCIDAGLTETADPGLWDPHPPNLDLDGKPRVLCDAVDMGAYEFGLAGDVDCDRDVDMADFSQWSACMDGPGVIAPFPDCSAFDFDGDEDVDLADFARFSQVFSPDSP